MPTVQANIEHSQTTRMNRLRYQFTPKHHGGPGSRGQAQWILSITFAEEFSIFDEADSSEVLDIRGNMYGVLRDTAGELRDLGSWEEQIAKIPQHKERPMAWIPLLGDKQERSIEAAQTKNVSTQANLQSPARGRVNHGRTA
jgi:hypothetical protein